MNGSVYETEKEVAPARHCFAVLVDDEPGVLARVIGLVSGRGYNIESLTVDIVDVEQKLSRITLVTSGAPMVVKQIKAQLGRLVPVRQVVDLTEDGAFVESRIAFVKLIGGPDKQADATMIARKFGARVANTTGNAIIFELTSDLDIIDRMIEQLKTFGAVEVARSGTVAMSCGENMLALPVPVAEAKIA
jgi:acetolactate synthase I/III small subunit